MAELDGTTSMGQILKRGNSTKKPFPKSGITGNDGLRRWEGISGKRILGHSPSKFQVEVGCGGETPWQGRLGWETFPINGFQAWFRGYWSGRQWPCCEALQAVFQWLSSTEISRDWEQFTELRWLFLPTVSLRGTSEQSSLLARGLFRALQSSPPFSHIPFGGWLHLSLSHGPLCIVLTNLPQFSSGAVCLLPLSLSFSET